MHKAFITGATGQDGSYLTRFLLSKGYQVYGLGSDNPNLVNFQNFSKLGIDPSKIQMISLDQLVDIAEDDLEVYHFAAQSSVGQSWQDPIGTFDANIMLYLQLLEALNKTGKKYKLFFASSAEIFGDQGKVLLNEDSPKKPNNPYSVSKLAAHNYGSLLREAEGAYITNAILFNHESPLRDERFVIRKIVAAAKAISEGQDMKLELGNIEVHRDWGFAGDYVEVMWQLLQQPQSMDIVVATGKTSSLKYFVQLIFQHFGVSDWEKHVVINPEFIRKTDQVYQNADTTKLLALGITLPTLDESLIARLV